MAVRLRPVHCGALRLEHANQARALVASLSAADSGVAIDLYDGPAPSLGNLLLELPHLFLDRLDTSRRKFDVVMAWAIDRLGRSLIDLLEIIKYLEAVGVDQYLDQQNIDTTTPHGELVFQVTGAFGEFERAMIRQRVKAGLNVIKDKLARDGKFESKRGIARTKLGRPAAEPDKIERARWELARGIGIGKVAREVGLGVGTVHRLKREIGAVAAG